MSRGNQGLSMLLLFGCALMAGCSDGDRQEVEKMKMKTKNSVFDKPFDTQLYEKNKAERIEMEMKRDAELEKLKETARAKTLTEASGNK